MTLTYRGQTYEQQEVADTFNKPDLTCRGDSHATSSRLNQDIHNPAFCGNYFCSNCLDNYRGATPTGVSNSQPDQGKGLRMPRGEHRSSRAMRHRINKLVRIQSNASNALTLFRFSAQNDVPHDRSRRRLVLSAIGSLSQCCRERKESLHHRVAQIWG